MEVTQVENIYDISMDVGNKVKLWAALRDWQVLCLGLWRVWTMPNFE